MNLSLQSQEIDSLLSEKSDSIIWTQKVSTGKTLAQKLLRYLVLLVIIILLFFVPDSENQEKGSFTISSIVTLCAYGAALFYDVVKTHLFATLTYAIYPRRITFEWGYFKPQSVNIPFDDITAINLVEYDDSELSTIHFGTKKVYNIQKIDFENYDSRPHITFEKIKNGKKVYELLTYLQKSARH